VVGANYGVKPRSTFDRNITCAPTLLAIARGALLPNVSDIELSCDPDCRLSLLGIQAAQQAACSTDDTIVVSGTIYPPTYYTDLLLDTFDYACLQNE
jgi:hypothetical protein